MSTLKARLPERECPNCPEVQPYEIALAARSVALYDECETCHGDGKIPSEMVEIEVFESDGEWWWIAGRDGHVDTDSHGPFDTPAEAKAGALRTLGAVEVTE